MGARRQKATYNLATFAALLQVPTLRAWRVRIGHIGFLRNTVECLCCAVGEAIHNIPMEHVPWFRL